ncbi:hypothetical protein SNEBB_008188, partial [Seison nebaliae]
MGKYKLLSQSIAFIFIICVVINLYYLDYFIPLRQSTWIRENHDFDKYEFDLVTQQSIDKIFETTLKFFTNKSHFETKVIPMENYGKCFNLMNSSAHDLWNYDAKSFFSNPEIAKEKEKQHCMTSGLHEDGKLLIMNESTLTSQSYLINQTRWSLLEKLYGDQVNCILESLDKESTMKKMKLDYKSINFSTKNISIEDEAFMINCSYSNSSLPIVVIESYFNYNSKRFYEIEQRKLIELKKDLQHNNTINRSNLYNVIILGIDSISSQTLQRLLPLSFAHMISKQFIFFKLSQVIGPNTFPNFVGLLTGMSAMKMFNISTDGYEEYKEEVTKSQTFDKLPFLWRYLPNSYITYKQEDYYGIGMFYYLLRGFKETPTDIHFRKFYKAYEYISIICNKAQHFYNNLNRFFVRMKNNNLPFFLITHFKKYSHNNIVLAALIDKELMGTFKTIENNLGSYNNSIIILFGDHGARLHTYGYHSTSGVLERKKSTIMLHIPPDFREEFPHKYEMLKKNSDKLVTPIDIHFTLLEIFSIKLKKNLVEERKGLMLEYFNNITSKKYNNLNDVWKDRSLRESGNKVSSLLSTNLSYNRSCLEANINLDDCLCSSSYNKIPL